MRRPSLPSLLIAASVCLGLAAPSPGASNPDLRLLESIKERDQKTFDTLLRSKVDINVADPGGSTPLAWAIHLGERGMALALLNAGANIQTADSYGETP